MSKDIDTRGDVALVKAKSRALVGPEPTDLVERRPAELVERRTEALVEAEPTTLVEPRPTTLVKQRRHECPTCGYKSEEAVHERICPECGGTLRNAGTGRD
ncbi:rubrerythrin-like domain-containing protein [Haloferax volcanii]|uniref:rubrerythrin-like domain-containing protein n=1 Tax=Haloferax volcanii TaxID=2246 RepID=UPI00385ECDBD